jgi:hypothetical protein
VCVCVCVEREREKAKSVLGKLQPPPNNAAY